MYTSDRVQWWTTHWLQRSVVAPFIRKAVQLFGWTVLGRQQEARKTVLNSQIHFTQPIYFGTWGPRGHGRHAIGLGIALAQIPAWHHKGQYSFCFCNSSLCSIKQLALLIVEFLTSICLWKISLQTAFIKGSDRAAKNCQSSSQDAIVAWTLMKQLRIWDCSSLLKFSFFMAVLMMSISS